MKTNCLSESRRGFYQELLIAINMKLLLGVIFIVLISGCATRPSNISESKPVPASRIVMKPNSNQDKKATVTVIRDSGVLGSALSITLLIDGREIAHFRTREKLTFTVDEGSYILALKPKPSFGAGIREYAFEAENGEHYYYRISVIYSDFLLQRTGQIK